MRFDLHVLSQSVWWVKLAQGMSEVRVWEWMGNDHGEEVKAGPK